MFAMAVCVNALGRGLAPTSRGFDCHHTTVLHAHRVYGELVKTIMAELE
jgi:hypothetical protein